MGTLSPCFVKGLHNELPEGGKIILLFGSNYTEGRGGGCPGDYQIWSQFTTFQIQESESDANRGENLLTGTTALNSQLSFYKQNKDKR